MKKNPNNNPLITTDILKECGLEGSESLNVKTTDGICLIHKAELTALELGSIITALTELASDMTVALAAACGICDHCGEQRPKPCGDCKGGNAACAFLNGCKDGPVQWVKDCTLCQELLEGDGILLPDYVLEEAGIPKGAKLEVSADEDSGEIIVYEADIQQDITDMPAGVVSVLAAGGVCLAELDELIMLEEIVYGK